MQLFRAKIISISQKIAQKNRTFQSDESDESDQSDFPDKALEKSKNLRFYPIFSDLRRIFISLTVVDEFSVFAVVAVQWKISGDRLCFVAESLMESKTKNIKNSLGATWNASHLAVRLCALRHWKRVSMPPTTQSLRHPLTRAIHIAPRIKTARRFTAKNP